MKMLFSVMSTSQTHYHFKLEFQKEDYHAGDKWLIHGNKHWKDNKFQNVELPCRLS